MTIIKCICGEERIYHSDPWGSSWGGRCRKCGSEKTAEMRPYKTKELKDQIIKVTEEIKTLEGLLMDSGRDQSKREISRDHQDLIDHNYWGHSEYFDPQTGRGMNDPP